MGNAVKKLKVARIDFRKKYVCMECGCQQEPIMAKRGMLIIELLMWLLYILPGVIYPIWRRVRKHEVCPNCGEPSVVLTSSSRAMKMTRLLNMFPQPMMADSPQPVSGAPSKPVSGKKVPPLKPEEKSLKKILKTSTRRGLKPKGQQGLIDFKSPDPGE